MAPIFVKSEMSELLEKQAKLNAENQAKTSKKEYQTKARAVLLTVHQAIKNKLNSIIEYLENKKNNNYVLVYEHINEVDKNGQSKPSHYHVYAQYTKPTNITASKVYNAHIKTVFRSAQKNIAYLKGQDKNERHKHISTAFYYESGAPRYRGGAMTANDVIEVYKQQGHIRNLPSNFYNVHKAIVNDYNQEMAAKKFIENKLKQKDKPIIVNYHVGESGSGKTTRVCDEYYKHDYKDYGIVSFDNNGFAHFLGSENCKYLMINEFRDSNMNFKTFLEILQNEHQFNIKGGSMYLNNLEQIDITTIQPLHTIYKNIDAYEDRYQIERRITNTYYYARGKEPMKVKTMASSYLDKAFSLF